ncbi:RNA-dependent RNA polymerase, partial [Pancytospora philotis]
MHSDKPGAVTIVSENREDVLARMPAPDPLLGSLLRRALEQETCVYCPCPQLIVKFLEELVRLFEDPSKIGIVTEDGLMVAAEAGAETPASQGYLRCNLPKCLKKVWTLSALATAPLSQLSCVVFYGIEDILALEARIEATGALLHGVMFKTAVTACPSAFRAYLLRSRAKYFSCVLSEFTVQHSYGGFLRAATVVGYAPFGSRPADAEMEQKVLAVPIRAQLVNELVSMLKRNVFDSGPFENLLGFQYISEKLVRLREIVAASGGQPLVIYVSGKKDRGILATIVQRWVAALEPAVSVCAARVPSSAHTISIVDSIPAQTLGSACLVLFDPLPALAQPSVFVLADRREQELLASRAADEQKVFDQLAVPSDVANSTNSSVIKTRIDDESCAKDSNEEERSDGEKIDDAEIECGDAWDREGLPSIPRVVKQKLLGSDRADVYGFAVVTKKSFMVAMEDREELDVLYTKSGINASFVYARCNSGRFAKLVQLHDYLRLPIQVPITRREGPLVGSMILPISALSTGTLTDYGSFVPAAVQQQNQGFVRMFPREIVVYSFTAEHLLRIQVFKDGIEHCIVMNAVSDDTDDNLYNRCNVYLPLKYHPCLCVCDSPDALRKLLASEQPQEEKFRQIEAMPWARAGVGDVPLFAGAHDIHLSMVIASDQRTALSDNGPFVALARALCSYGLKILYKEVAHKKAYLSLQSFLNYFLNRDYATYYSVLSLVSRKGRFLVNRLSLDDVTFLQSNDTGALCGALDSCLRERFRFPSLKSLVPRRRQDAFVRTVVLKPTSIEFGFERLKETNRVLRHFDTDKFMRFSMRDNNGIKLTAKAGVSYERLFDYLRQEMLTGISAGPRRYFFLAATTSQLNEHCAWFVTPYEHEGALIGADYIKSWLGNFKDIKNIGKYTVRVAQALSTTKDTCVVTDFVDIPDICRDGHTFTDGIGLISPAFAAAISKQLGYNFVPSAFQIRFAGYKGVVAVHPLMDDSAMLTEWCVRNGVEPSLVLRNPKENKSKIIPGEHTVQLILRASMNKFPSPHRMLEVITYSRSYNFYLNRQIILVLEGLGVPPRVFKELQNKAVLDVLWEMNEDTPGFIRSHVPYFPKEHISTDYTFFRKLVAPLVSRLLESLNTKAKIPVEEGRAAIGVTDELGILEKDEVFLMFLVTKDMNVQKLGRVVMHDGYAVPVGPAFVVKNPCTHPGDVRVVTCVDRRELHYLKECLVFPQTGDRPLFNQCSGSDLDGDIFLLSW